MPNPDRTFTVDREAVKTLAIAIGIRKAAQKLGLSEVRVRQWSSRYKWFPSQSRQHSVVTNCHTKPSDALTDTLRTDSEETRLNLSKAAKTAAATFARQPGTKVIRQAQQLRHVTAAASTVHGWEEQRGAQGINLNVGILLGGMQP